MSISEQEKSLQGASTLKNFCLDFGDDVHANILLEVLFEGLMNAETIFVFGEPVEEGDQIDHSSSGRADAIDEVDELKWLEDAVNLGKENPTNYP